MSLPASYNYAFVSELKINTVTLIQKTPHIKYNLTCMTIHCRDISNEHIWQITIYICKIYKIYAN